MPLQVADKCSPRQLHSVTFIVFSMFSVSILSWRLINGAQWHVSRGQQWCEDTTPTWFADKMQMMNLNLKVLGWSCRSPPPHRLIFSLCLRLRTPNSPFTGVTFLSCFSLISIQFKCIYIVSVTIPLAIGVLQKSQSLKS